MENIGEMKLGNATLLTPRLKLRTPGRIGELCKHSYAGTALLLLSLDGNI